MSSLLFRNSFASRYKLGNRRKHLSERTLKSVKDVPPVLLLDIDYFCLLLESRQKYSKTPIDIKKYVTLWINATSKSCLPTGILAVVSSAEIPYAANVISVLNSYTVSVIEHTLTSFVYSLKISGTITQPICIVTNNLSTWAMSNTSAELSFVAIDSNNRSLFYNNATGLDFFCRFIMTNKIINKLGLQHIKYLNLQYLYLLLMYLNFTNQSSDPFFFDSKFILSLPKHKNKNTSFSRSNGIGLSLISQAHKLLSYAFLTKPEFADLFLLGTGNDFTLHLSRLPKLLPFDKVILGKLHHFYTSGFGIHVASLGKITTTLTQSTPELSLSRFLTQSPHKTSTLAEIKTLSTQVKQYLKLYPAVDLTSIFAILPESSVKQFSISSTPLPKTADTIHNESDAYISTLLAGIFNG